MYLLHPNTGSTAQVIACSQTASAISHHVPAVIVSSKQ